MKPRNRLFFFGQDVTASNDDLFAGIPCVATVPASFSSSQTLLTLFFSEMAQFLNIRAGNVKGGLLCCRAMRIQFPIISHQSVLCICIPAAQRRRTAVTVVTIPSPEGSHRVKPKRLDPKKTTKQCNAKHIRQISNEQMSYKRNSSNFDNDDKCIYIYIINVSYNDVTGSASVKASLSSLLQGGHCPPSHQSPRIRLFAVYCKKLRDAKSFDSAVKR